MEERVEILIVTGNPEYRRQLLADLRQAGEVFAARTVGSLREALDLTGRQRCDGVLLDLDLPDSQGLETLRRVRHERPELPVVVLTHSEAEGVAALRAGAQDAVTPGDLTPEALARVLRQAILRQRMVRALEASEAGAQLLLRTNPDGLLVVDQEGVVRQGNLAAGLLLGCTQAELIGKPLGFPVDMTGVVEWRIPQPGGTGTIVEVRAAAITWEGGPAYLVSMRDITARHQAERTLRATVAQLSAVTDAAQDAIITIDDSGAITYWNPAAERLFGYTRQEALGQDVHALLAGDQARQRAAEIFPVFARTGQGCMVHRTTEMVGRSKSREGIPVEISTSAFQVEGRWHAIAILRDIRRRKQAEAALQRLNRLYRLLSAIDEAILTAESPAALFDAVCQAAVEPGGMRMAWLGLLDEAREVVRPVAEAGAGTDYLRSLRIVVDAEHPEGRGPTARALREGRVVTSDAIERDPAMAPWRAAALQRGYRSSAAVPFRRGGRVVGTLNLYAAEAHAFGAAEVELLERVGRDVSRALGALESEAQRQQAVAALAESERRFRAILEGADLYAVIVDTDGKVVFANDAFLQATGWGREEVLGQDYLARFAPHDELRRQAFLTLRENGTVPSELQHRLSEIVTRDGRRRTVEWSNFLLRGSDGRPMGLAALGRDMTETLQAQRELAAQYGRLALLQELTRAMLSRDDLVSMLDAMLTRLTAILSADMGAVAVLRDGALHVMACVEGNGRGACQALRASSPLDPAEVALLPLMHNEAIHLSSLSAEVPCRRLRALRQVGLNSVLAVPLQATDELMGVLVLGRVTAAGFSETEISTLREVADHAALAVRHVYLYEELRQTYQRLHAAQQEVMEAARLRALGQMASGIAHDINNAISPAVIYATMLARMPELDPLVQHRLEVIQRAISDVSETVERLREFYRRREPGEALLAVDLNEEVRHVVDLTRPRWADQAQARGVAIEVHMDLTPHLPPVQGVPHEIREALTNLVLNAVDAMPDGGTLTLRTYQEAEGTIVAEVEDSGVGMDEATLARAAEPFFTTKGESGTGLGLSMVYGIMERHGGRLTVQSKPGVGTVVRLVFPAWQGEEEQPAAGEVEVGRLRILVIDDQTPVRVALQDMLESLGHEVTGAAGGRAGLAAFEAARGRGEPFDVVITDMGMPEMTGREVVREVKGRAPETPVIILSGWGAHPANGGGAKPDAQADAVLSKPPRLEALSAALARVMGARRSGTEGQEDKPG